MDEKENKSSQQNMAYNPADMTQIICPDCGQATVVNLSIAKRPYCSNPNCGRPFNIQKPGKKKDDEF